ncbi:MAG: hypothetical protein ACI8QZ_002374 [Chlamydiales bacterium]|jgi:hypothetical protein
MVLEERAGLISGTWETDGQVTALAHLGFVDGELTFNCALPDSEDSMRFEGIVDADSIFGVARMGGAEDSCFGDRSE